jgi:zinc finger FYVE domain-containing protein 26
MELALDVATRCQIESEPVWTQWGLALLSLGKYKIAREKFKYCTSLSVSQKTNLLTQILHVLEGGPTGSQIAKKMKDEKGVVEIAPVWDDSLLDDNADIEDLTKQQRTSPLHTHMDQTRIMEAKHYILSYGNDDVYILFLVRNGQIETALSHVISKSLPAALFVETIASYCLRRGIMSYLIRLMSKYGNMLNNSYLTALCKYLNAKEAFNVLYRVQVFMEDHVRAGLTCVRLFIQSTADVIEKLRLLEEAKKHFVQGLSQMQRSLQENMRSTGASFVASSSFKMNRSNSGKGFTGSVLKPEEISKYIKTIDLQAEVTHAQVTNENLFGPTKVKCDIVEVLLGTHFDLAFRIANEFHLPIVKLYARQLCDLSRKKQINIINELLKNIRSTPISDDDWDTIINTIIKVFINEMDDKAGAEKFIARLKDDSRKVKACLMCQRYKAAYLIAVKDDRIQDVKLIYNVTSKLENNKNAQTIAEISYKFLVSKKAI